MKNKRLELKLKLALSEIDNLITELISEVEELEDKNFILEGDINDLEEEIDELKFKKE